MLIIFENVLKISVYYHKIYYKKIKKLENNKLLWYSNNMHKSKRIVHIKLQNRKNKLKNTEERGER